MLHHAAQPGPHQWQYPSGQLVGGTRGGAATGGGGADQSGFDPRGATIQAGYTTTNYNHGYQPVQCSGQNYVYSSAHNAQGHPDATVVANNGNQECVRQIDSESSREQAANALLAMANGQGIRPAVDLRYKLQRAQDMEDKTRSMLQEIEGLSSRIGKLEFGMVNAGYSLGRVQQELQLLRGGREQEWAPQKYFSLSQGQWLRPTEAQQTEDLLLERKPSDFRKKPKKKSKRKPRNRQLINCAQQEPTERGAIATTGLGTQSSSDSTSAGTEVSSSEDGMQHVHGEERPNSEQAQVSSTEGAGRIEPPASPTFDEACAIVDYDLDSSVRDLLAL